MSSNDLGRRDRPSIAGRVIPAGTSAVVRTTAPIVGFFVLLQLFSAVTPEFVMPSVPAMAEAYVEVWTTTPRAVVATFSRVVAGLVLAFVVGVGGGILMGIDENIRDYGETFVKFLTGIPGLSWVLLAVLWFQNIQIRIVFVLFMVLFPWYALSTADAIRGIPRDLSNMVKSFRFTSLEYVRKLVAPYILPDIVAVSKSNVGYATRVVVVAELVGAATGIGKEMLIAQSQFETTFLFAWTFVLVTIMFALQGVLVIVERTQLTWRTAGSDS
jgi:ABC-type nitrate/sulfonate/bicarbonate transport system permease component